MKSYAQNKEDLFVLDYFKLYQGTLLEIGSNDGITLSNSNLLIEHGWKAVLVEPGDTFTELVKLHLFNKKVRSYNVGIGSETGLFNFWESESHVPNGIDRGLVSTLYFEETKRWPDVKFKEKSIWIQSWDNFYNEVCERNGVQAVLDYISIDAEGEDWKILQQIDLEKVGCKCLCIEWNSKPELFRLFRDYCSNFGLFPVHQNNENLIFCK